MVFLWISYGVPIKTSIIPQFGARISHIVPSQSQVSQSPRAAPVGGLGLAEGLLSILRHEPRAQTSNHMGIPGSFFFRNRSMGMFLLGLNRMTFNKVI
jgi:hypothetical protein